MPMSFGTSTSVISLPARSGALVAAPPSYGFDVILPAPPSQGSGLVGRSSAPCHLSAAKAGAANALARSATLRILSIFSVLPLAKTKFTRSRRRRRRLSSAVATAPVLKEIGDQDGKDQHRPDHDNGGVALDAGKRQPVLQELDKGEAEHRAADRADAAENRRAPKHDRGDDIELQPGSHVGARRGDTRHKDRAGDPGHQSRQRIDHELNAIDLDRRIARRGLVVPDRIERAAKGGARQDHPE